MTTNDPTLPGMQTPGLPRVRGSFALQPGRGHLGDEILVFLAFIVLPLDFPPAQPFRAPFALLLLAYAAMHWRAWGNILWLGRWWFAFPALCGVSLLWADASAPAVQHAIYMTFSMALAAFIAVRLDARQVAVALLLSQGVLALASLLEPTMMWVGGRTGEFALVGVFPHKNVLGKRTTILLLAALAIAIGSSYRGIWRALSLPVISLSATLLVRSSSATSLIILCLAGGGMMFLALLWRPLASIRFGRPVLVLGGLTSLFACALIAVNAYGVSPVDDALDALGKDRTLTGRTVLWDVANESIADHPMLGVGAGNFWRIDNNSAVHITTRFEAHAEAYDFHNVYYEVLVHLGLVGLAVGIWVYGRASYQAVRHWWRDPHRREPLYVAIIGATLMRTLAESDLFYPVFLGPILFWVVAFSALANEGHERKTDQY